MLISIGSTSMHTFENIYGIADFGQRQLDMLTWMGAALKL